MRRRVLLLLCFALAAGPVATVAAHDGVEHEHEHADAPAAAAPSALAPRIAFATAQVEVVVVREAKTLLIYVDDYASNAPRRDLQLSLQLDDQLVAATPTADGSYRLATDTLGRPAEVPLPVHLHVHGAALDEDLRGELPALAGAADAEASATLTQAVSMKTVAAGALALALLAALLLRARRRR